MTLIDLSHPIEHDMVTYPGLPGPRISDHMSFEDSHGRYAEGTEFAIGAVSMVANTGTYLDTPAHRYRDGHDLAALPLERCADLPTVVVEATGGIGPDQLPDEDLTGHAVLLRTGWDRHWRTEHYGDPSHPFLTADGARHLVGRGAVLVGIDTVNIDDTSGDERPAHTLLLGGEVLVLEHLTGLDRLPERGARLTAAPPAVVGMATFPVRAFARI
ncbi:cyclase family protein [Actinomycetospora soli]|uniref:cyclase family protein n=1 Tax=Actinomycetospora soli TaxID=2893887 RepID=UPI001E63E3C7|nr:cyclase family protein [Actinomycetospora soli]MCD2189775.1 cyclase family protein [Actinomycetospora soli]